MKKYEKEAMIFSEALKNFAKNPDAIDNIENYLSYHFETWIEKYAKDPYSMASDLLHFSKIQ